MIVFILHLSNILYQTYKKGFHDQSWSLLNQCLWGLVEISRGLVEELGGHNLKACQSSLLGLGWRGGVSFSSRWLVAVLFICGRKKFPFGDYFLKPKMSSISSVVGLLGWSSGTSAILIFSTRIWELYFLNVSKNAVFLFKFLWKLNCCGFIWA